MAITSKILRIADNAAMTNARSVGESATTNQFDVTDLEGGTTYYVEVDVTNARGTSTSAQSSFTTSSSVSINPFRIVENSTPSRVVTLTKNGTPPEITLEYSVNKQQWHTWEPDANGNRSYTLTAGNPMHIRGNNPNGLKTSNDDTNYYSFDCDENYSVAGDIRSLISPSVDVASIPNHCFRDLFRNSRKLISAPYLRLLATTLGSNCYGNMFYGCTAMTHSPHILPATTVNASSYWRMFRGCSSLQTMPIIDGTTFGASAVRDMFYGCSALTNQWASDSPSVETKRAIQFTIASTGQMSLRGMFQNCTSLVNAGGITASQTTNWSNSVCYGMFEGCTALTTAPSITFESFDSSGISHCYQMFKDCTSLETTPNIYLDATTLYTSTYKNMYHGCTSLTTAPEIMATTMYADSNNGSMTGTFYGCSSLGYIKVNFTDWNNGDYTHSWTYGTKSTGRFDCPASLPKTKNASGNTSNAHYIPYNWTINGDNPKLATPSLSVYYNADTGVVEAHVGTIGVSGVTYYFKAAYGSTQYDCTDISGSFQTGRGTGDNSNYTYSYNTGYVGYYFYFYVCGHKSGYSDSDYVCFKRKLTNS